MPKLNKDSLAKMFTCNYCGKLFRTRQGLSGHIQFKHGTGKKSVQVDSKYILSMAHKYEEVNSFTGMPLPKIKARQEILVNWLEVEYFCSFLGITLSPQDFKNYIIVSMALQP